MITDKYLDTVKKGWRNETTSVNISINTPEYIRKVFYHNFTYNDVYIVDRSKTPILVKGFGPDGSNNSGFKVKIERELTIDSATRVLNHLNEVSKTRVLNEDEMSDLEQLSEQLDKKYRSIRLSKSISINLAEMNDRGFFYCAEIDCMIYKFDYVKEKIFPFNENGKVDIPDTIEVERIVPKGTLDLVVIDNQRTYDHIFTRVLGRIVKVNVIKDSFMKSGIYIKIDPSSKLEDSNVVCDIVDYNGSKYEYYDISNMTSLGLYTNQTEARNHERMTNDKSIELEQLKYQNQVSSAELIRLKNENEKLRINTERELSDLRTSEAKSKAELNKLINDNKILLLNKEKEHKENMFAMTEEHKARLAEKDLEIQSLKAEVDKYKLTTTVNIARQKANIELGMMSAKSDFETFKMQMDQLHYQTDLKRKKAEAAAAINKIRRDDERMERRHMLEMSFLDKESLLRDKDLRIKSLKLDNELLQTRRFEDDSKYRDAANVSKAGTGLLNLVSTGLSLFAL